MKLQNPKKMQVYNFYPSILDTFYNYINCSKTYQKFWGNSESPSKSVEEYEQECFNQLIDRINRVPFESEAADKGTAYNELIDCIIEKRKSEIITIERIKGMQGETISFNVGYKNQLFSFDYNSAMFISQTLHNAICQELIEANLQTSKGLVRLYGYADYILPNKIIDLKTTSAQYQTFKYRENNQHLVYLYCLQQKGIDITLFEYLILQFGKGINEDKIYTEYYNFDSNKESDLSILQNNCTHFIDFLESNKHLITDKKIFGID